jgi:hypothetical protein
MTATRLVVGNPSALSDLAASDDLGVLLRPGILVTIPDVIYTEVVRTDPTSASKIVAWVNGNSEIGEMVRLGATYIGIQYRQRLSENVSTRGMIDKAVFDTLETFFNIHPTDSVLLLAAEKNWPIFSDPRVSLISLAELRATGSRPGALK